MGMLTAPHQLVPHSPRSDGGGGDIVARLRRWHATGSVLFFLYARSLGGLMQSGRGRIVTLGEMALTIDAGGSTLLVMLGGAALDDTPQIFFTPDLSSHFQVPGVGLRLGNHDWLFFSDAQVPETALPAAALQSRLPGP